jgi:hypothetical protein
MHAIEAMERQGKHLAFNPRPLQRVVRQCLQFIPTTRSFASDGARMQTP